MYFPKDVYEYLTVFCDDKTIINMLSVNKKFNNEEFYHRVVNRKYPLMLDFKRKDESSKNFFLRKTYYLSRLKRLGIPYIPLENYDPEWLYKSYNNPWQKVMDMAAKGGLMDIVQLMIRCGARNFTASLGSSAIGGHVDIFKFLLEKGASIFNGTMLIASTRGHLEIVKLSIEKGCDNFGECLEGAASHGHFEIVKLLIEYTNNTKKLNTALSAAAAGGYINIVQFLLNQGADDVNSALEISAPNGRIDIARLLIEKGATNFSSALNICLKYNQRDYNREMINLLKEYLILI